MTKKINYTLIIILLAGFLLRLYGINNSVLEGGGNWREADTATVARNYFLHGYNFLYPEIDYNGYPGYVETEFPLVPFLVSLAYGILGAESLPAGRLVSVIFALGTVLFLYRLGVLLFSRNAGLWAGFFYSVLPLGVYYTRTIQPESAMMFFMASGVYYFMRWIKDEDRKDYVISLALISMMLLVKITTAYMGLVFLLVLFGKFRWDLFKKPAVWVFVLVSLLASFLWYRHAHNIYAMTGNTFFNVADKISGGFRLNPAFYSKVIFARLGREFLLYSGFIFFIIGLFKKYTGYQRIVYYWLLSFLIYIIILAQAFWIHIHWLLPLSLPVFLVIGRVLEGFSLLKLPEYLRNRQWKNILVFVLLVFMVPVGILHAKRYYGYPEDKLRFCNMVRAETTAGALIITDTNDPSCLFQTGRKGFTNAYEWLDEEKIISLRDRGATHLFTVDIRKLSRNRELYGYISENAEQVLKEGRHCLFEFK